MTIEQVLAERGGVAHRDVLVARSGASIRSVDRRLAAMVAAGTLLRPRRGLYALPQADPAVIAATSVGGLVTCVSAAQRWGLPLLTDPSRVHLAVPRAAGGSARRAVPASTVLHWDVAIVPDRDRAADVAIALSHVVRCLPLREAVAVFDGALRRGLVELHDLRRARPRLGWLPYEQVLTLVDPGAQSIGETFARVALTQVGLTVRTQVHFRAVGWVDLVVEGSVVVEVDGFAYHSGRAEFRNDRRRDRILTLEHGMTVLRFAYEDAVHDTGRLVSTVQQALAVHARRTFPAPARISGGSS